jgi:hypothetical protein
VGGNLGARPAGVKPEARSQKSVVEARNRKSEVRKWKPQAVPIDF